jgi:hypothetical protein
MALHVFMAFSLSTLPLDLMLCCDLEVAILVLKMPNDKAGRGVGSSGMNPKAALCWGGVSHWPHVAQQNSVLLLFEAWS